MTRTPQPTREGVLGVPPDAVGLRLGRFFPGDDLRLCEAIRFKDGPKGVDTILRRAAISGRVEMEPWSDPTDYIADILDAEQSIIATVALDAKSFRALKGHWMRCKYEPVS